MKIKSSTGIPNNVLSRFAICIAIENNESITGAVNAAPADDAQGKTLDRDLLFGAHVDIYTVMIREYMVKNSIEDVPLRVAISRLIEIGSHRMGHVQTLQDLASLAKK